MTLHHDQPSNQKQSYRIGLSDLPLSCPQSTAEKWDNHPRVYLSISKTGYASCPYCGTEYYLDKDNALDFKTQNEATIS